MLKWLNVLQPNSFRTSAYQIFFLMYHHHNIQHVHTPLGTANINAYPQVTGLWVCFAGWQV